MVRARRATLERGTTSGHIWAVTKNQDAAANHLKRKTMQEKIDAYFEGYRRIPDGDDPDFIAMEKAWLDDAAWADEEWPEAPNDAHGN